MYLHVQHLSYVLVYQDSSTLNAFKREGDFLFKDLGHHNGRMRQIPTIASRRRTPRVLGHVRPTSVRAECLKSTYLQQEQK